ncbi:monoglyceride lipase-like [Gigantopelta aegis]|uniref:monoglyceride lipase-like n=1 Tax=Gigantopelta aegis TaxID=1735272 RepID=UPI001B88B0AE|nr:monoglyceride lipase-like [Gigantopelta aegis]
MSSTENNNADQKQENCFTNDDGLKIFCKDWGEAASISNPRCLVFIAHGLGEHCLWYDQLAEELTKRQVYVFSHDHIGHGQSEGDRVHINNFKQYTRDVFYHVELKKKKFSNIPVFMIGHSMGGAMAILCALERPEFFKGIILIAPAIIVSPAAVSPLKVFIGRWLSYVFPQLPIAKLDPKAVCRDPNVVKKYEDDPLVYHGGIKVKLGTQLLDSMDYICANLEKLEVPFLALHGDKDTLAEVDGSKQLGEKAKSKDKTLKIYEGYYHQLHNEPDDDGVGGTGIRAEIVKWIVERMPA